MDCYLQMLEKGWHQHQHITKRTLTTVKIIHFIIIFVYPHSEQKGVIYIYKNVDGNDYDLPL